MKRMRLGNVQVGSCDSTSIVVVGRKIEVVGPDAAREGVEVLEIAKGVAVFPGFIDIHNHGAVGVDVNVADADGLLEIAAYLAKNGVTAWVPTLVPDSDENYARVIAAIDRLMEIQSDRPIAQALGVHYEGVFANEKMCGALRPEFFKNGSQLSAVSELPRLKKGVHMTTLAPEVEGGIALITELRKQGWIVSIGHTKADSQTLDQAFAAGAHHMTHFFNAMTGVHHREVGVAGWGLSNKEVTFDIIADGIHVDPRMLEFAILTKSPDKVSLISDSAAPTGLSDGSYSLWGETITVKNGRTRNERGSIAGSVITMLDAVKRMRSLAFSDADVSKMASGNPAKLVGCFDERGSIEVGKRADLVGFDESGDLKFVMIGGRVVTPASI
ncbi:MAG: N-acetylglucosamine-6-phosphate deacetylase [Acidobacteriota bacterium]